MLLSELSLPTNKQCAELLVNKQCSSQLPKCHTYTDYNYTPAIRRFELYTRQTNSTHPLQCQRTVAHSVHHRIGLCSCGECYSGLWPKKRQSRTQIDSAVQDHYYRVWKHNRMSKVQVYIVSTSNGSSVLPIILPPHSGI